MTVKELIEKLKTMPPDALILREFETPYLQFELADDARLISNDSRWPSGGVLIS